MAFIGDSVRRGRWALADEMGGEWLSAPLEWWVGTLRAI
jgi:hypothetical protein